MRNEGSAYALRVRDSNAAVMLPSGNRRGGAQTDFCDGKRLVEGEIPGVSAQTTKAPWALFAL